MTDKEIVKQGLKFELETIPRIILMMGWLTSIFTIPFGISNWGKNIYALLFILYGIIGWVWVIYRTWHFEKESIRLKYKFLNRG